MEKAKAGQRQLGHASIKLILDHLRKWLPLRNEAAGTDSTTESRSKTVAKTKTALR